MGADVASTIGRLVEERAKANKDRVFLFFEDQKITWVQIDRVSNQIAFALRNFGIIKGDKVILMMQNHPEFIYAWFGITKLGAVEVPVNIAYKGDLLSYIIDNSDSKLIFIDASLLDRLAMIRDSLEKIERIVCKGEVNDAIVQSLPVPVISMDEFYTQPSDSVSFHVAKTDPVGILYTSGTTGPSKGVVLCHNAFIFLARLIAKLRQLGPQDILYTFLPLFHGNAQILSIMNAVVADSQVVLSNRFSASTFWDEIRKYKATQFNYLGAVMTILSKQPPRENDIDNPVRICIGAACPADVMKHMEERFGIVCLEGYGLTEAGIFIHWTVNDRKHGSCGKVVEEYYEANLVDDEDNEVPVGQVGEIIVRPKEPFIMMSEYYKMPEKTLESYRNLWFHTGDYVRKDEEGYFYFVDRKKDAIRRRGENISSFEVEKVINSHPEVLESAVFAIPSELGEDDVKANVVLKPGEKLSSEELIRYCNERMAYFAVPRYLEFVAELPKTPTNRIEKYRLREAGITANTWDREKSGIKIIR
ncbi:MAG: AMP-binding protein [Deltaproteobacteria bacterium]|nr:AMP-binding protein [Deltaproteobacteria bacterium]